MIKKVTGTNQTKKTSSVESTNKVAATKVGAVSGVGKASEVKFRSPTREITADMKKQLFQILEEEADKLLSDEGISEKRKARVKNALKMAIEAGNVDKEEKN